MELTENYCNSLLENDEIFSAHLVIKIMRGDFVLGRDGIDHWIEFLKNDDLYIIYRFFLDCEDSCKIPNKQDILDLCSMLFYIKNNKDGSVEEINELYIELKEKINKEVDLRGI
jgi:hypothetical protein